MEPTTNLKRKTPDFETNISPDQALEWLNSSCKVAGRLIGITRNETARDKWCLTYNEKAHIAECTTGLFNIMNDEEAAPTRKDSLPNGIIRDEQDILLLVKQFERFKVFEPCTELCCISTNDLAPDDIREDLLEAEQRGLLLLKDFVRERIINRDMSFFSPIHRNKSRTFGSLSLVTVQHRDDKKVIQADRNLFHRLLVATDVGRKVDLSSVLEHELCQIPLAIADLSGALRSTTKSDLADILQQNLDIKTAPPDENKRTCLMIDQQALIQAIGKPVGTKTFGEFSDIFCERIVGQFGGVIKRSDVLFDRYQDYSTKSATCVRSGPIRKIVDNRDVPLPQIWKNFIDLSSNKADFANFLSTQLAEKMINLDEDYELVTSGGFYDATHVVSSKERDLSSLSSNHEEADTRLILHAHDGKLQHFERTVIECSDTDVLVLGVHFMDKLTGEVWFKKGKKYIPLHNIELSPVVRKNIITFHGLTGCDTTSSFSGIGKKTAWKIFQKHPELLNDVGTTVMDSETKDNLETFVCQMYGYDEVVRVNEVRRLMFLQAKKALDGLPPS